MKPLLYCGATLCLVLACAIASKGKNTQVILPDGAPMTLSQTGVLPVQIEEENKGIAPAIGLMLIGVGLAACGSIDLRPKDQSPQSTSLEQELAALLNQAERGALLSPSMQHELQRHYGTQWRSRLGLPIQVEDLTVELPPDLQNMSGSGTSTKMEEKQPEPAPAPKPKPIDHSADPRYRHLFELVDAPCIRIYGPQGSGKSSKLAWFGLEHVKRGDRVIVINPMARADDFDGIKVYGRGLKYKEAEEGISEFVREAKRRLEDRGMIKGYDPLLNESHWSLLCDEMSDWGDWVDSEIMNSLIGVQQQFLRQANMSIRQVSHGDTNAMNGGAAMHGRKDAMNRQLYKIETSAKHDSSVPGKLRCAGQALLHCPDRAKPIQIEIPVWMQAPKGHDFRPFLKRDNVVQLKA